MINNENEMREDILHDKVGGLIKMEEYRGSSLNLEGFKMTRVIDDILLVEFVDLDGGDIKRDGIVIPHEMMQRNSTWRVGKVLLAGPKATTKVGELVCFPNDKGMRVLKLNGKKDMIFLNEERIFGIVEPMEPDEQ